MPAVVQQFNKQNLQNFEKIKLLTEAVTTDVRLLKREHIEILPKDYILQNISAFHLRRIWNDLPKHIQEDSDIQSRLPCIEHHNRPQDRIHRDGPAPPKYLCRVCKAM